MSPLNASETVGGGVIEGVVGSIGSSPPQAIRRTELHRTTSARDINWDMNTPGGAGRDRTDLTGCPIWSKIWHFRLDSKGLTGMRGLALVATVCVMLSASPLYAQTPPAAPPAAAQVQKPFPTGT